MHHLVSITSHSDFPVMQNMTENSGVIYFTSVFQPGVEALRILKNSSEHPTGR